MKCLRKQTSRFLFIILHVVVLPYVGILLPVAVLPYVGILPYIGVLQ